MSADCPGCWPTPKLPITRIVPEPTIKPCDAFLNPGRCNLTEGHDGDHAH